MQSINKGAPLDVAFINDMVNDIEKLQAEVNASLNKRTTLNDAVLGAGQQSVRTADARINAIVVQASQSGNNKRLFTWNAVLDAFNSTPVITASPTLNEGGSARPSLSVVVEKISNSAVSGYVTSNEDITNGTVVVSLIAIGIPSVNNSTG